MAPKLCSEEKRLTQSDFSIPAVITLLLLPCQFCLVTLFLCNLFNQNSFHWKDPMAKVVSIYLIIVTIYLCSVFYVTVVDSAIQSHWTIPLGLCQFTTFMIWFCGGLSYASIVEIYLMRCQFIFQGSVFQLSRLVHHSFRLVYGTGIIICTLMLMTYSILIDCWNEKHMGFLSSTMIYPRIVMVCHTSDSKYEWLSKSPVIVTGIMVPSLNLCLMWMFISRLKRLTEGRNAHLYSPLIERATVTCLCGIISTIVCFLLMMVSGFSWLILLDVMLNEVLLYCNFEFGNVMYHWMFDSFLIWLKSANSRLSLAPMPSATMTDDTVPE